jgi:hypothetical protein
VRLVDERVPPVLLGDPEAVQHHLRPQPSRCERHRGGAVRCELVGLHEREPRDGDLGEVVVEPDGAAVVDVEVGGAVGDLDQQTTALPDQQWEREVAGDDVGVDGQPQQAQPLVERVLPHRPVPLGERITAPHVVDEHVEAALLAIDPFDERPDLLGIEVIHLRADPDAAGGRHELGGLLDRLGTVHLRTLRTGRAPGRVHRRTRGPELHRDAATGATRRTGDERDLALQRAGGH